MNKVGPLTRFQLSLKKIWVMQFIMGWPPKSQPSYWPITHPSASQLPAHTTFLNLNHPCWHWNNCLSRKKWKKGKHFIFYVFSFFYFENYLFTIHHICTMILFNFLLNIHFFSLQVRPPQQNNICSKKRDKYAEQVKNLFFIHFLNFGANKTQLLRFLLMLIILS